MIYSKIILKVLLNEEISHRVAFLGGGGGSASLEHSQEVEVKDNYKEETSCCLYTVQISSPSS